MTPTIINKVKKIKPLSFLGPRKAKRQENIENLF
jgi:hypothetical protein